MPAHPQLRTLAGDWRTLVGEEIGVSTWTPISQAMIDAFAEVTRDHQWIHTDPDLARTALPGGKTVAHGFLTLSLASHFAHEALPPTPAHAISVNYGFDRVRFTAPVTCGAQVRGRFVLLSAEMRADGSLLRRLKLTVEIRGQDRPALVADWLTLVQMPADTA